ncbi:MAG: hypothetical protein ABSA43_01185 [Candidatus Microgenomates bacterium]|jgi:Tfp pilus assembly protein PilN
MPKINFLPPDLVPKSLTVKITKVINKIVIAGFALFICIAVVLIALFVLDTMKLKNLEQNKNQLLDTIKNNQQAEQGLYLVRDRLSKIKQIQAQNSIAADIKVVPQLLSQLPGSILLTTADLSPTLNEIDFQTTDPMAVSQLMATVIASDSFGTVNLKSFSFSETQGYKIVFEFTK